MGDTRFLWLSKDTSNILFGYQKHAFLCHPRTRNIATVRREKLKTFKVKIEGVERRISNGRECTGATTREGEWIFTKAGFLLFILFHFKTESIASLECVCQAYPLAHARLVHIPIRKANWYCLA